MGQLKACGLVTVDVLRPGPFNTSDSDHRAMASLSRIAASTATPPPLPDELLEEIFLRLDAAADLARASASCTSFRRVVSRRRFLRRFRSLHPPPVLGLFDTRGSGQIIPLEPLHPSAAASRALAQAADFTYSFVPGSGALRDARDGRVLLCTAVTGKFEDLVVCDPQHRRYARIPPIPDDLAASAPQRRKGMRDFRTFLAPAGEDDSDKEDEESSIRAKCTSFRVIRTVEWENKVMVFIFSSGSGRWRGITYHSSSCPHRPIVGSQHYYAHGCFFWKVCRMDCYLMLDTREMKFSTIDLPPGEHGTEHAIVEAGEERLGFLVFDDGAMELYCKIWQNNGVGGEEWQHDKTIPLPGHDDGTCYDWSIIGAAEGYLLLLADHRHAYWLCFILDLKTLLLERLCAFNDGVYSGHIYASFPPPLAQPSI
ncbi:hypothetical protein ACP70R_032501 [Stipagrostis hirtigluma subsp. patula]